MRVQDVGLVMESTPAEASVSLEPRGSARFLQRRHPFESGFKTAPRAVVHPKVADIGIARNCICAQGPRDAFMGHQHRWGWGLKLRAGGDGLGPAADG